MALIEIFDLDEEQAAQAAKTPEATPKKKRTPRKKSAEATPETDSAASPATASDAPAPRRGRKPKATAAEPAANIERAESHATPDNPEAPKKSRSRKPAAKTTTEKAATPAARAENANGTENDNSAAPAPARRSRSRKPKAAPEISENSGNSPALAVEAAHVQTDSLHVKQADSQLGNQPHAPVLNAPAPPLAAELTAEAPAELAPATPLDEPNGVTSMSRPLVQFEPVGSALAPAFTLSSFGGHGGQTGQDSADASQDADAADGEAPRPSKSRSRSARRRKAAARRRAEAAAGSPADTTVLAADAADRDEISDENFEGSASVSSPALETNPVDADSEFVAPVHRESDLDTDPEFSESAEFSEFTESDEAAEDSEASENPENPQKKRRSRSRGRRKNREKPAQSAEAAEIDEGIDAWHDEDEDFDSTPSPRAVHVDRKMLVSVLPGELTEVVLMEAGKVQEYYVEMDHQAKIRGNIYKGIVSNIDVNLQAAFVNYGNVKNGFLQIDEVHPEYWLTHHEPVKGHKYPPIQKVMKPGQEVLVQVVKEPNGAKGAFLTTWVSLAGRFLVLTPGQEQIGISRKVEDGEERNRLRELIKGLNPGEGLGAIVRTVSAGTSKTTLQKDLSFLKRVWKDIRKRAGTEKSPSLIYKEPGLASRSVRDYLSDDVSEIWVDDAETTDAIRDMTTLLFPRKGDLVHVYQNNGKTLWEQFKVRKYLDQIHAREVVLPSGGRLVFDQTEALMAIDINSGKTGGKTNFESMALRTNVEAAEMIAHQLRLRDVGGQVVIDFIEMRDQSHVREVEKTLRNAMKCDRARYDIGKMSAFGLLQIVRQRIGSSAISISQEACPHCCGTGLRRNMEWQSLQTLRDLQVQLRAASISGQSEFILSLEPELALYMLNHKRERLTTLEKEYSIRLEIKTGL